MTLYFHNSASGGIDVFTPLDSEHVRMYVCGPTVYDDIHIGNARPLVVFDVLFRLLLHSFPNSKVTYARNITDIDDKIIKRSKELAIDISELTSKTTESFLLCCEELNTLPPSEQPRASAYIPQMIKIIERLIANDRAYSTEDGHVLCETSKDECYGQLSNRSQEQQIAGARVEVASYKRNPTDFVLWKPSSEDQPGWKSPWGFGRPGWHTECVAMSSELLGNNFDIHGGGYDLLFPHHENELSQMRGAFPKSSFAQVWMHNGYVIVNGEKMSKSMGNFTYAKDFIKNYKASVLRTLLLMTHYRKPLNITEQKIIEAQKISSRIHNALETISNPSELPAPNRKNPITLALSNDLDSYQALTSLNGIATQVLKNSTPELEADLLLGCELLGIKVESKHNNKNKNYQIIQSLVKQRELARKEQNFKLADQIRKEIELHNVALQDNPDGSSSWYFL